MVTGGWWGRQGTGKENGETRGGWKIGGDWRRVVRQEEAGGGCKHRRRQEETAGDRGRKGGR
jgi:hypothetical protein